MTFLETAKTKSQFVPKFCPYSLCENCQHNKLEQSWCYLNTTQLPSSSKEFIFTP